MRFDPPGVREFGHLPDGTPVHVITLVSPCGMRAQCLTFGGILRELQVPVDGRWVNVVLGLPDLAAYLADRQHLGALIGRYGNRISHARFMLDGCEYQLDRNDGAHHLHGGSKGFSRRVWTLLEHSATHVLLHYHAHAGEQGYPGALSVSARLELHDHGLELQYRAQTDASTVVNLTHHPYFNLAGYPHMAAHPHMAADLQWLRIPANGYLPIDHELIPLGTIASVEGSPFDFRMPRPLFQIPDRGHEQLRHGGGYDHCLVLEPARTCSAELYSAHSGIVMRMQSPMPGVQLYGGQGLGGEISGICLEPQYFPDAPNQSHFPDTTLYPGQEYRHRIHYQFAVVPPGSDWETAMAALKSAE